MPGISVSKIPIPFPGGGGTDWDAFWASLISATVENAAPTHVVLTFSAAEATVAADITATVNGAARAVSSASWTGAVWTVVLASAVVYGDVVVMTFVPSGGTVNVTNNVIAVLPLGLIAKWNILGDLTDSVGGFTLTNNNGVLTTDRLGRANSAYDLVPATSAWLTRAPFTEVRLQEFTVAKWFKADALSNYDVIIGDMDLTSLALGWGIIYISAGTKLRFFLNHFSAAGLAELTFNDTTSWHCVIASYKKAAVTDNVKISIDGGAEVITSYNTDIAWGGGATSTFTVGRRFGPGYFDGKTGPCYFWNRELTAAEKISVNNYYL